LDRRRADGGERSQSPPDPEEKNVTSEFIERFKAQKKHNFSVIIQGG
jgi:hypothetical protein